MLLQKISSIKGKKIALITHSGADVDAICAAASLYFSLSKKNKASILVPEHISMPAKTLAKKLKIPYTLTQKQGLRQFDTLFLIDFNDIKMAGSLANEIKRFKGTLYLIDHHRTTKKKIAPLQNTLADQNAVASCELVFDLLKKSHIPLDKRTATYLAAGLVTDSAYFLTANSKTFSMMSQCLKASGKTFSSITSLFSVKQTFDEKIAKLKAAKRARIFLISDYIAVMSDVGAFESDAASALVKIGADIAFVGDSEEGKLRISSRASQAVTKKAGFDLAKHVFQKLPNTFPGSGGGHAGAAGFNGKGNNINAALQQCINLTKQFFKKRKGFRFKEYT
jgi:nanoRNase/pAp phosphatase (c-di-AMP/oligoRNAs hydrolase)